MHGTSGPGQRRVSGIELALTEAHVAPAGSGSSTGRAAARRRQRRCRRVGSLACRGERAPGGGRPERGLLHRRARPDRECDLDADPQAGRDPTGEPRQPCAGGSGRGHGAADGAALEGVHEGRGRVRRGAAALAAEIKATAATMGSRSSARPCFGPGLQSEYSFPVSVHQSGADCVVLAGSVAADHKVVITTRIHQLLPKRLDNRLRRHVHARLDQCRLRWRAVTGRRLPGLHPPASGRPLSGGAAFIKAFEHVFGGVAPGPYALFGYTAMELGLQAIASAGRGGDSRAAVRSALFSVDHASPLGTFAIEPDGQTTFASYGLYRVGRDGDPPTHRPCRSAVRDAPSR